jgi:hypothetical protein
MYLTPHEGLYYTDVMTMPLSSHGRYHSISCIACRNQAEIEALFQEKEAIREVRPLSNLFMYIRKKISMRSFAIFLSYWM